MNVYLQNICRNAYMDGFKAGTESVPGIDIAEVRKNSFKCKRLRREEGGSHIGST